MTGTDKTTTKMYASVKHKDNGMVCAINMQRDNTSKQLAIKRMPRLGELSYSSLSLRRVHIADCRALESVRIRAPNLVILEIANCPVLRTLGDTLAHAWALKVLDVCNCPELKLDEAEARVEDLVRGTRALAL